MSIEWQVSQMLLSHPVHGRFTVSFYNDADRPTATALRCYGVSKRLQTEWVGGDGEGGPCRFPSIEAAQAAVAMHCALLDAGLPEVCSALSDGYRCEQLEAR